MFNIEKLTKYSIYKINKFAKLHQNETFYGLSITGNYLCLNSEEKFQECLAYYIKSWEEKHKKLILSELTKDQLKAIREEVAQNVIDAKEMKDYYFPLTVKAYIKKENEFRKKDKAEGNYYVNNPKHIKSLRLNPGDWAYTGFAILTTKVGFDNRAFDKHYELSDKRQKTSEYGRAMDKLIKNLVNSDVFSKLKTTKSFFVNRLEFD